MIKPLALRKGNTIGIVSPSAGLAGLYFYRVRRAISFLEKSGFKIKLGKNALKVGYIAGEPEERARDMNEMIYDKKVRCIITTIGGENAIQLLEYLDFKAFKKMPKIFVGYSDITVLHLAFLTKSKVVTFYGPAILPQFGEYPKPFSYTINYFKKAVMESKPIGLIQPVNYTDQFLDWGKYKRKKRTKFKENRYIWVRKGKAKGKLIGGCLPSILRVAGTEYFPSFKNALLFIETPEGDKANLPYGLEKVDADISQLKAIGVFDEINGLIVGVPYRYNRKMKFKLIELLKKRLSQYDFPILFGVNFGHTDPIITLPYGIKAVIESSENKFQILESAVK